MNAVAVKIAMVIVGIFLTMMLYQRAWIMNVINLTSDSASKTKHKTRKVKYYGQSVSS